MAYTKVNWQAGVTPLSEANMDHLETQYDEAKTDLDAHTGNTTTAHGAVSAATASKHVVRDASARAKFAAPGAAGDALIKGTRHLIAEMPILTTDKYWKGVGGVPAEADAPVTATKERWTPCTHGTEMERGIYFPGALINAAGDEAFIGFYVPHDFASITEVVVVRQSKATATHRLNYYSAYGAVNAAGNSHTSQLLDQDTAETNAYLYEEDISGILSVLAVGDFVSIRVLGDGTNTPNDVITGVRLKYS